MGRLDSGASNSLVPILSIWSRSAGSRLPAEHTSYIVGMAAAWGHDRLHACLLPPRHSASPLLCHCATPLLHPSPPLHVPCEEWPEAALGAGFFSSRPTLKHYIYETAHTLATARKAAALLTLHGDCGQPSKVPPAPSAAAPPACTNACLQVTGTAPSNVFPLAQLELQPSNMPDNHPSAACLGLPYASAATLTLHSPRPGLVCGRRTAPASRVIGAPPLIPRTVLGRPCPQLPSVRVQRQQPNASALSALPLPNTHQHGRHDSQPAP